MCRIVFMGTPDFAVAGLKEIIEQGKDVVGVVTAPDKPAGRGQKLRSSAVKAFAESHGLLILQPTNLKDPGFIEKLKSLNADIFVVVAFRMLPKDVWQIPKKGTFNLHASLLPQYRGAAPINWAIINGEVKSGITTFLIDEKIDTGRIIMQEEVDIDSEMNAGQLHDILMLKGSKLIDKTIDLIHSESATLINQDILVNPDTELKPAPKIFKEQCRIDWTQDSRRVHNLIRGLSPFPASWTIFEDDKGERFSAKIYEAAISDETSGIESGIVEITPALELIIGCGQGAMKVMKIQAEGKKAMETGEFLRGYRNKIIRVI